MEKELRKADQPWWMHPKVTRKKLVVYLAIKTLSKPVGLNHLKEETKQKFQPSPRLDERLPDKKINADEPPGPLLLLLPHRQLCQRHKEERRGQS